MDWGKGIGMGNGDEKDMKVQELDIHCYLIGPFDLQKILEICRNMAENARNERISLEIKDLNQYLSILSLELSHKKIIRKS